MQVPAPVWPTRAFLLLFLLDIRYMDPPDIDRFRIQSGDVFLTKAKRSRGRLPHRQKGEWFLKGPIPGAWLTSAASLPGKALHVALAAWTEAMMKRSATVTLTHMAANRFGVGRNVLQRGLKALEAAHLICVDRKCGRCPRVTIIDDQARFLAESRRTI